MTKREYEYESWLNPFTINWQMYSALIVLLHVNKDMAVSS